MKKFLRFAACGFALVAAATFTGCSSDDDPFYDFDDETPQTRASVVGDAKSSRLMILHQP